MVSEMTLRCAPKHKLLEHTYVTDLAGIRKDHVRLLDTYRHVRFCVPGSRWVGPGLPGLVPPQCTPSLGAPGTRSARGTGWHNRSAAVPSWFPPQLHHLRTGFVPCTLWPAQGSQPPPLVCAKTFPRHVLPLPTLPHSPSQPSHPSKMVS